MKLWRGKKKGFPGTRAPETVRIPAGFRGTYLNTPPPPGMVPPEPGGLPPAESNGRALILSDEEIERLVEWWMELGEERDDELWAKIKALRPERSKR